jgi:cytidine deaminase
MSIPPATLEEMKRRAREAAAHAYAPYSAFPVGAAVLCDGAVYVGTNVENVSYGLSICAERNAVFAAIAHGARRVDALIVYTPTHEAVTPCGACLQVVAEFGSDAMILCCTDDPGAERRYALRDLLPAAFSAPQLARR